VVNRDHGGIQVGLAVGRRPGPALCPNAKCNPSYLAIKGTRSGGYKRFKS
jgi:hypothetical protein